MKKISFILMAAVALLGFSACSSSDDGGAPVAPGEPLKEIPASMLGSWDKGYLTPQGIFLNKKYLTPSSAARRAPGTGALNTETLYFQSADGATKATLLVNKDDNRPLQFIMKEGVLNFSFLSDELLELVFKNGSDITYVDQIPYNKAELDAALAAANFKTDLQRSLFFFVNVTDITKLASYPTVIAAANYFREVVNFNYTGSSTMTATEATDAGIEVASDGTAVAATEAETFEDTYVEPVYSTITVWTGKASFKVGGSSCTLSGTLFCADARAAEAGIVGIVCDKDPKKLFVGQAEFQSTAELKDGKNFEVDFRGFNPKTTYYYRAYYQFTPTASHDGLVLDPAQKYDDATLYDNINKQFATGEYKYTVDVVMLMDISGSMSDELGMVKSNAKDFFTLFKSKCDAKSINLTGLTAQVVTYSDINEDYSEALNKSDIYNLLSDAEHDAFEGYVNDIYLTGGGDYPESGLEALATAFQRDWGPDDGLHRQVFILWTDATYLIRNDRICRYSVYDDSFNVIDANCEHNEDGSIKLDEWGDPIGKQMYQEYTYDQVKAMWDGMTSGRRFILIAPYGTYGASNEGDWGRMDDWKNFNHIDMKGYDYNFSNVLDGIIDEMIGKEKETDVPGTGTEGKARKAYKTFINQGPKPVN